MGPVPADLPGFPAVDDLGAGMVEVVDAPWGVGGYDDVMGDAAMLEVADGLTVAAAFLESVICSKEAMVDMVGRPLQRRTMDGLHVLMGEETLVLAEKYGARWDRSTPF
ncbi:MAG: hypothetical protein OXJ36_03435 [bacterium]|nr:hypothetical protein [bacterium]MDE0437437.1 hypothetical protein [bacterium]